MAAGGPHVLDLAPHAFTKNEGLVNLINKYFPEYAQYFLGENGFLMYVTNTVFSTWIFLGIVIILATLLRLAVSKKLGFVYTTGFLIVKHLKKFFGPLLGHNLPLSKTLWFVGGIFLYILGANLYSLGLDWILAFSPPSWHYYLRPINADINTTLGMAALMIFISHMIMIRYRGFFGYVGHFLFHFHGHSFVEKCISVIVGWLHLVGEGVRVLALSLRLFGNIFAGVVLIGVMVWLSGLISVGPIPIGSLMVIPFYFLEMFVGFIQAMVFALLVSMYFAEASEHAAH